MRVWTTVSKLSKDIKEQYNNTSVNEIMEYKDGVNRFDLFVSIYRLQLQTSGVPDKFWLALFKKLENQIFDAGNVFSIFRIDYEEEGRKDEDPIYTVLVTKEDGINCDDGSQIYLIDHAWTYKSNKAAANLTQIPGLLDRMCNLMGIPVEEASHDKVENVCKEMWRYNQTYSQGFGYLENRTPVWYIMDEFGCAIEHSDSPNFKTAPIYYLPDQTTYTLLFPVKNVSCNEKVTRDYLGGLFLNDELLRKALLIPWRPCLLLDTDFTQVEPDENYFLSEFINEVLPVEQEPIQPNTDRVLKVYSEYELINDTLNCSGFEITYNRNDADILWLTTHFKDYKAFSEQTPEKFVNQFPYESVLTIKNLLAAVCRRNRRNKDKGDNPVWFPTTYDLNSELVKFVSYFQHKEKEGLNNLWICKPWNMARGLDTIITDNLNCILRLPSSGPKIAQKYIHNPVLFNRSDVGLVKFDVRYVLLVKSIKPLHLYAYRNFFLRFANKPFDLTDFWDIEKHFTVMNYNEETPLFKMLCCEFIEKFNEQNPQVKWSEIEDKIYGAFRELFEAASSKPPPCGIGHNVQSRALFAVDLMLCSENGEIQPKILEVNWMPDCKRACEYYPEFFNDIFSLLFKNNYNESLFQKL